MAYTFLLKTSDTENLAPGKINLDRTTAKYVGSIQTCAGRVELSFIEIEIGERLKFVKKTASGEIVSYDFQPDPETPKLPESLRDCVSWWVGESFEEGRIAVARCVLSRSPSAYDDQAPKPPVRRVIDRSAPLAIASHASP